MPKHVYSLLPPHPSVIVQLPTWYKPKANIMSVKSCRSGNKETHSNAKVNLKEASQTLQYAHCTMKAATHWACHGHSAQSCAVRST
jgi:hypothetical protein